MANLVAPFDITGNFPIDKRLVFNTIEEMKNFDQAHLPDAYFAVCVGSNKIYVYNSDNEVIESTGKWREISGGSGDATFTEDFTTNITVGGIDSGTEIKAGDSVCTVIKNMLLKYIKPVISLTLTPNKTLYYIGENVDKEELKIDVTKNSGNITKIIVKRGNDTLTTEENAAGITSFKFTDTTAITNTVSYSIIGTGTDEITASKSITFCNPSFIGTVDSDVTTPTEDIILNLSKYAVNKKGYTYTNFTMDYGKILYAYPKTFGSLTSITDGVNNYTNSYEKQEITININGTNVDYLVYLLKDAAGISDPSFKQIYS